MDRESVEYYRARARHECEAALNATCAKARHAHGELAKAYARRVEIAELDQAPEQSEDDSKPTPGVPAPSPPQMQDT
ncbi:MAG: hypothetical protein ABI853_07445 [Sphingomicrobium sp.]